MIEFPPLHPVGSPESLKRIRPPSEMAYPCEDITGRLGKSDLIILDRWRPASRRSGINVLRSPNLQRRGRFPFHVVSLRRHDSMLPEACFTEHPESQFATTSQELSGATVLDGGGLLLLKALPRLAGGSDPKSISAQFYQFTKDGDLESPISRHFEFPLPFVGTPTPLCFVSGTTLMKEGEEASPKPNCLLLGVISFDSASGGSPSQADDPSLTTSVALVQ
ncbi:hypothetical protein DL93DRAFT_377067 [Clavulina sp. PMI_390]|nr:hypothetical protein DL93DRAFT_377067 [Clavulina sp. PMI_390]